MGTKFLYTLGIFLLHIGLYVHGVFNNKSKNLVRGRKNWRHKLSQITQNVEDRYEVPETSVKWVWIHVSSLGEYEQAFPLIQKILQENSDYFILTTFFSPSGYEQVENIDRLFHMYLPWDYPWSSRNFIELLKPKLVIFDKYDFWFNILHSARDHAIPLLLINAYFKESHRVFKASPDGFYDIFSIFTRIYTQDRQTARYIEKKRAVHAIFTGDTRVDRVLELSQASPPLEGITRLLPSEKVKIIAGSTWAKDEKILSQFMDDRDLSSGVLLFIVPHDIRNKRLQKVQEIFKAHKPILFSQISDTKKLPRVIILDQVGVLKHIYKYFTMAYIGGGFGKGVHSVLEPAVYGIPLFYGPHIKRSFHAYKMAQKSIGFKVVDIKALKRAFAEAQQHDTRIRKEIRNYIDEQKNATNLIYQDLKRYL